MRFNGLGGLIAWLTLIPGLVGTVLAAPLLVSLEQGTQRLDWTQSITRRRWLVTKLGLAAAAAVVAAGVLVLLVTWWRMPFVRLQGRMDNSVFDSEGTVVLGYTLFALALCTLVGVLWRRAVPALMVGFAGYFAVRILFDTVVRQHLLTPLQATWRADGAPPPGARHAWVLRPVPQRPPRPPRADRHHVRPRARHRDQLPAHARRLHARRLPPRQPLLGPTGDRDRDLRRAGARHARVRGVVGARAGELERRAARITPIAARPPMGTIGSCPTRAALVDEIANELDTWPGVHAERRADGAAVIRYEELELGVLYPTAASRSCGSRIRCAPS